MAWGNCNCARPKIVSRKPGVLLRDYITFSNALIVFALIDGGVLLSNDVLRRALVERSLVETASGSH